MSDRVVPLQLCGAHVQTEGQVVLSELPGRPAERDETEGPVPEGAGTVQQRKGGKNLKKIEVGAFGRNFTSM